ncbi:MAG: hypothetical protein KA123_01275 [Candidatus Eisenbacteria bacterium]|nr:hypothetical protein [Candidatus Eisenbacteria bacterium]
MVKARDWEPVVSTNGLAVTPALLRELKRAGAYLLQMGAGGDSEGRWVTVLR